MQTTIQGTLNDAAQARPSQETLREDFNAIYGFEITYDTIINKDVQHDALDQHSDFAALFTESGHSQQIMEQRTLINNAITTWQDYHIAQDQVLRDLKKGDFNTAHDLENSRGDLELAGATNALLQLTKFNGGLAASVHDATNVEENNLLFIIILAACCVLVGIGVVGWLVSSTLIRRLRELRSIVQSIEKGQLDARVAIIGHDEIADVSLSVNAMLDTIIDAHELEQLHHELRVQHEALNSANARLEALVTTDVLTELPNHRALISTLDQELERAHRYQRSCSMLFLDIDHFKALNDGYGHAAGDAVLAEFASLLRAGLRRIDTVGRWGGEEFIAILPEMTEEEAYSFAERVRADVANYAFNVGGGLRLTCSLGIACYPAHAQSREELITVADQAMYGAKRLGRNQVRIANDPLVRAILLENNSEGGREEAALTGIVEALTRLIAARDSSTGQHSRQVGDLLLNLTREIGLPDAEAQMIALAGCLHDIGKISIPDAILKKPGKLTDEEWTIMRTHPVVGAEVVSSVPMLRPLAPVIRSHHERWDGRGYPDQLASETIPFGARIIAVVDAYTAMTTDRPYQKARPYSLAMEELKRCAGSQFDPQVVNILERLLLSSEQIPEIAGVA